MLAAAALVLGLALSPPFLPPGLQAVVMDGFASVCHQMPGRSPHLYETSLAVCDRCIGIYGGLVLGLGVTGAATGLWGRLWGRGWGLLAVGLAPAGIDWAGPLLGLWSSVPLSRALTGLLAGVAVGTFLANRLLREAPAPEERAA